MATENPSSGRDKNKNYHAADLSRSLHVLNSVADPVCDLCLGGGKETKVTSRDANSPWQNLLNFSLVGWLVGFLTSSSTTRLYRGRAPRQERLTILRAATHETELGDHGFCFSRSHYTDTDPTSRERAATAGIEPGSSSPGVARSTAELPRPELFATPPRPSIKQQNTETSTAPEITAVISRFTVDIPGKLKLRNSVNLQKINIPELLKKTFDDKADKPEEKLQILNLKIW